MGREVEIVLEEVRRGEKLCFSVTMWRLLHAGNDTVATKEAVHRAGPMRMINIGFRQGAQPSTALKMHPGVSALQQELCL